MDVRFAESYTCEVDIPQQALNMRMPSLSLLPLFENIVKHNVIDISTACGSRSRSTTTTNW